MARRRTLEASSIVKLNMIVRTVIVSLVEEINARPSSLWIVELIMRLRLRVCVVEILRLVRFFLTTRRSLPLIILDMLFLRLGWLVRGKVPRPLPRMLNPISNVEHSSVLTKVFLQARPLHQLLNCYLYHHFA